MLNVVEELGELAFEWAHKTLDILYEDILGFEEEQAKKASAWSGFALLIAIVAWVCYKLYHQCLHWKTAFPQWWKASKAEWGVWWASLSMVYKLVYVGLLILLLSILAMFI